MDGDDPVEKSIGKIKTLLAVANHGVDVGKALADFRGHVLAVFVGIVAGLLLGGQVFVVEVLAQAGADLQGGLEARLRILDRKEVVELLQRPVPAAACELDMPLLHEIIADALLLRGQRRQDLGPFGGMHGMIHFLVSNPAWRSTMNLGRARTSS